VCDETPEDLRFREDEQPLKAFWPTQDPTLTADSPEGIEGVFESSFQSLRTRIEAMLSLQLEKMTAVEHWRALRQIGNP
jgi:hypothetical protein